MSSSQSGKPHLDHLFQIGVLYGRSQQQNEYPAAVNEEASAELARYSDQGLIIQKYGKEQAMSKKTRAHSAPQPESFTGQGIIFAVIDNREEMERGATTVDTIADAIEAALDAGHETSEDIARYLTTSAFQHVTDKRVRFNSVLKAGDVVGAHMLRKLYNAYNDLATLSEEEQDPAAKKEIAAEARGFAEALTVVLSPFSCEDKKDYRLVDWDQVDRITDTFEKEQRFVRKERKGNPQ